MTIKIIQYVLFTLLCLSSISAVTYPYYCTEKDRNALCTMEYLGVCGWFYKTVNCLVYPCAITSGTACQACGNKSVEYVTLGECPKTGSLPITTPSTYVYTVPYTCKAVDRIKDCSQSTDTSIVCANKYSCTDPSCKFKSKPCDACYVPDVEILTDSSTCFGSFLYVKGIFIILFSLILI